MEVEKQVLAGESAGVLLDAFLKTVAKVPNEIALENENEILTFSELASQCSHYAMKLSSLIQERELNGYVPIFVSRDMPSAVSVLACYLYGIPFSPISSDWPADRLIQVLKKLGMPSFGIASQHKRGAVSRVTPKAFQLFSLDTKEHQPLESHRRHESIVNRDLGQVLFTSGTTGEPKGVEFNRTALLKKLLFQVSRSSSEQEQLGEKLSTFLGYPLNFTAGVGRLLGVVTGERIRILSESDMQIDKFIELVRRAKPKALRLPPSLLILLSKHPAQDFHNPIFPSVRQVSWGGDALSFSTIQNLKPYFSPNTEMMSGFGATEGSNGLNFKFVIGDSPAIGPMPIGLKSSIDDFSLEKLEDSEDLYVLRSFQNLATGYIGDPGLSSERFRLDSEGKRYWYSGDVVQIDHDGNIWHKGRVDDLVKIRGMLTSPSESTRALMQIPGIFDAIVLPVKTDGQIRLVAHIAVDPESRPRLSEIRRKLAAQLPPHLIPSLFVAHEAIPKNDRGKPDRRLLLSREWSPLVEAQFKPPVTPAEHALASHLQEILGLPQISIDENLWNSGLDSLAALELEVRLKSDFPTVTLDFLTRHSTIRSLARGLDNLKQSSISRDVYVLNPNGAMPPIYAFPGGGNLTTHFVHLARALGESVPIVCLLADSHDPSKENTSVEGRVKAALKQITVSPGKVINVIGYSLGGAYAYELARALAKEGIRVNLGIFDTSYGLVSGSKSRGLGRLRPKTAKPAANAPLPALLYSDLVHVIRTHGIRRSAFLITNQLFDLLMKTKTFSGFLRQTMIFSLRALKIKPNTRLVDSLLRHDLAAHSFKPLSESELEFVSGHYFYIGDTEPSKGWIRLIPNMNFVRANGTHLNMLNPPNVAPLAEKLEQLLRGNFRGSNRGS